MNAVPPAWVPWVALTAGMCAVGSGSMAAGVFLMAAGALSLTARYSVN